MKPTQLEMILWQEGLCLETSQGLLKDRLSLVETLYEKYDLLLEAYAEPVRNGTYSPTDEEKVVFQSLLSGRRSLVVGMTNLLRGHEIDSLNNLRRAIEYVIFACFVFERPGAATKWLQAGQDDLSWQAYRDCFKIMSMVDPKQKIKTWQNLENDLDYLSPVLSDYEIYSKKIHATILSAGPYFEGGKEVFYAPLVDVEPLRNPQALYLPFLMHVRSHTTLLKVQYFVLSKRTNYSLIPTLDQSEIDQVFRETEVILHGD